MHDGFCQRTLDKPCCVGKEDRATGTDTANGPRGGCRGLPQTSQKAGCDFARYLAQCFAN